MGKEIGLPIITLLGQLIFTGCVTDAQVNDNVRFFPVYKVSAGVITSAWIGEGSGGVATLHMDCLSLPKVRNDMITCLWKGYLPIRPGGRSRDSLEKEWMVFPDDAFGYNTVLIKGFTLRASHGGLQHSLHLSTPCQWRKLRNMDFVSLELTLETEMRKEVKTRLILRNARYRGNMLKFYPDKGNPRRNASSGRSHNMEECNGVEWIRQPYRGGRTSMLDTSAIRPPIHTSPNAKPAHNGSSVHDFFNAVLQTPYGQTNVICYAGTSNHVSVLVHETNTGLSFWHLPEENLDKTIWRDYSSDRRDWIILKNNGESIVRHWNRHKVIEDFVNGLPLNSALVRTRSRWYEVPKKPQASSGRVFLRRDFNIDVTLRQDLFPGSRICTTELFTAPLNTVSNILAQMRNKGRRMTEKQQVNPQSEYFITWTRDAFSDVGDPRDKNVFCVGDVIAAPFQFWWNMAYGDLIPFDEDLVYEVYLNRSLCIRGWKDTRSK